MHKCNYYEYDTFAQDKFDRGPVFEKLARKIIPDDSGAQLPLLPLVCHAKYLTYTLLVSTVSMTNFGTSKRTTIRMQLCHARAPFLLLLVLLFMQYK